MNIKPVKKNIPLLKEDNELKNSFYRTKNWENSKYGSYYDTVKKIDNISRFLINQAEVKENWEQNRQNNDHTKTLRTIDDSNKIHPTHGHPLVRPQQTNLWYSNGVIHTMAQQYDYNKGYIN